jgi:hypothetical protein
MPDTNPSDYYDSKADYSQGKSSGKPGLLKRKLAQSKSDTPSDSPSSTDNPPKYHSGGKVRKTGLARLKKGELVLTRKQARKYRKSRSK